MEGAVEHAPYPPRLVGQVSAVNPRYVRSSERFKAVDEGQTIRSLLALGRPQGVIGMWLWEGRSNAIAIWQAKRRVKDMRQRNQPQPPRDFSQLYRSERLSELYWRWRQWYRSKSRGW